MFSQSVIEQLGYYVYFLKDPKTQEVFYVGKGVDNRIFNHINCADSTDAETDKLERIRKIGIDSVEHYIVRHGMDEKTAFEVEAALIDFIGLDNLTNMQGGHSSHDFGIMTTEEIKAMYESEELEPFANEKCLLININALYRRDMSDKDIYEATRKEWVIGAKREQITYAIATYKGLTREVYKVINWYQIAKRWGFNGVVADKEVRDRLRLKSIASYTKRGAANPIRYINI